MRPTHLRSENRTEQWGIQACMSALNLTIIIMGDRRPDLPHSQDFEVPSEESMIASIAASSGDAAQLVDISRQYEQAKTTARLLI